MQMLINDKCKGFTLIEVLIATMIFSIIIIALFSSINSFVISSQTVKENIAHIEKIRDVIKRITRDIEALYVLQPPRYKKPEFNSEPDPYRLTGEEVIMGQSVVSTISFASLAHTISGDDQRLGVARIVYYLKENENNLYDLYRSDSLPPFPKEQKLCSDPVLCRNISEFKIVYRNFKGDEYSFWDSDEQEFQFTFPASIDLKITFGSEEKSKVFETSFAMIAGREPIE